MNTSASSEASSTGHTGHSTEGQALLKKPFHGGCQACGPGRLWVGDSKQEVLDLLALHMKIHMIVWENNA